MTAPIISASVTSPGFGTIGLPVGTKETGQRADFRQDIFPISIEAKGYRLAWTRATDCPCTPTNSQTQQSDPNCALCNGAGFLYFGSATGIDYAKVGQVTETQRAIIDNNNAYVIRGLMTGLGKSDSPWEKAGSVRTGTANLTVRPENRLGHYDRVVNLDSLSAYNEVVLMPATGNVLQTKYLIDGGVNLCRSLTTSYMGDQDFQISKGQITFYPGRAPLPSTRVAVHYFCHPAWLVMDFPHAIRGTNVAYKTSTPQTPEGDYFELALMATVRLEFLCSSNGPALGGSSENPTGLAG
jgi:hypothetical protein